MANVVVAFGALGPGLGTYGLGLRADGRGLGAHGRGIGAHGRDFGQFVPTHCRDFPPVVAASWHIVTNSRAVLQSSTLVYCILYKVVSETNSQTVPDLHMRNGQLNLFLS